MKQEIKTMTRLSVGFVLFRVLSGHDFQERGGGAGLQPGLLLAVALRQRRRLRQQHSWVNRVIERFRPRRNPSTSVVGFLF